MAIIQISKIQLRRGPSIDLPGKPTKLVPLEFEPGLDPGEVALTSDLGRVFIGHEPKEGHVNFGRQTFPYQNIEILTENSSDFIETLLSRMNRDTGSESFHSATLAVNAGDWAPVVVSRAGAADYEYRLDGAGAVAATIEYTSFDANGAPVRIGHLMVYHNQGASEPSVTDSAFAMRRLDIPDPDSFTADELYNLVEFRFTEAGPVGGRYLVFEYRNRSETTLSLQFRTSNPKAI